MNEHLRQMIEAVQQQNPHFAEIARQNAETRRLCEIGARGMVAVMRKQVFVKDADNWRVHERGRGGAG